MAMVFLCYPIGRWGVAVSCWRTCPRNKKTGWWWWCVCLPCHALTCGLLLFDVGGALAGKEGTTQVICLDFVSLHRGFFVFSTNPLLPYGEYMEMQKWGRVGSSKYGFFCTDSYGTGPPQHTGSTVLG